MQCYVSCFHTQQDMKLNRYAQGLLKSGCENSVLCSPLQPAVEVEEKQRGKPEGEIEMREKMINSGVFVRENERSACAETKGLLYRRV